MIFQPARALQTKIKSFRLKKELWILLFVFFLFLAGHLRPKGQIDQARLAVGRWPCSPQKRLQLAEILLANNQERLALNEYYQAEGFYHLSPFALPNKLKKKLLETKKLVFQAKEIREEIDYWQKVNQAKPYYRDGLLNLSLLYYQLWQDQLAQEVWQKAFYLDPNNTRVKKIGTIIEVFKN